MSVLKIVSKEEKVLLDDDGKFWFITRVETLGSIYWYHPDKFFDETECEQLESNYRIIKRDTNIETIIKE